MRTNNVRGGAADFSTVSCSGVRAIVPRIGDVLGGLDTDHHDEIHDTIHSAIRDVIFKVDVL